MHIQINYESNKHSFCNRMNAQFIDTADYTAHFITLRSFLNILSCRALPKLLNGTIIVFLRSHGKVMLSGVDYLNVIIF